MISNKVLLVNYCIVTLFVAVLSQRDSDDGGAATSGDSKYAKEQEVQAEAAKMKRGEETGHNQDPSDRLDLALLALESAFVMAQRRYDTAGGISVTSLIDKYLKSASGESRYFLMKMIELMDQDQNYMIEQYDFVNTLKNSVAFTDHAIINMFQLYDQNRDGVLTKYEWVQAEMRKLEDNESVLDLWRNAGVIFHERDQNKDNLIDEAEYAMYALYELTKSISSDIEDQDNNV